MIGKCGANWISAQALLPYPMLQSTQVAKLPNTSRPAHTLPPIRNACLTCEGWRLQRHSPVDENANAVFAMPPPLNPIAFG